MPDPSLPRSKEERRRLLTTRATVAFPDRGPGYWDWKDQQGRLMCDDVSSDEDSLPQAGRAVAASLSPVPKRRRVSAGAALARPSGAGLGEEGAPGGEEEADRAAEQELERLQRQLQEKTDELEEFRNLNRELENTLSHERGVFHRRKVDLDYRLEEAQHQCDELRAKLHEAGQREDKHREQYHMLEQDCRQARRALSAAKQQLSTAQDERDLAKDNEREAQEEVKRLLRQGLNSGERSALESRIKGLEREKELLQGSLAMAKEREQRLKRDLDDAKDARAAAEAQLKTAARVSDADARRAASELQRSNELLSQKLREAKTAEQAATQRNLTLTRELEDARRKLSASGGGGIASAEAQAQIQAAHERARGLQDQVRKLQDDVQQKDHSVRRMKKHVERLQEQKKEMISLSEYRVLEENIRAANDELELLRNANAAPPDISAKLRRAQHAEQELRKKLALFEQQSVGDKELKAKLEQTRDELHKCREENSQLQRELHKSQAKITELLRDKA
eukprot:TRINITY_DN540_c0_g2_i4.p1 TRINITY_DN540_c0_g2~~TRINITY_DN540_c0_g2_i4.p1  ORF type:complete len:543 (+),score=260.28 TRINITY_DN540_c0_g2_i4:100-1629(+)